LDFWRGGGYVPEQLGRIWGRDDIGRWWTSIASSDENAAYLNTRMQIVGGVYTTAILPNAGYLRGWGFNIRCATDEFSGSFH